MLPNSNDLYYFQEVSNTLNVSRAAERLGVTQPSVTMSIKRLEENIGEELFIRSKKGMTLTKAGESLRLESRSLMEKWEDIRSNILLSERIVKGRLKFGVHSAVAMYTIGAPFKNLLRDHDQLEVTLKHDLSRNILEEVISHNLDMGLVINPVKHPDLILSPICSDEVCAWSTIDANKNVIICDPSLLQSKQILNKVKKTNSSYRFIYSNDLHVVTKLTQEGVGLGIIPERVAKELDLGKNLRKVKNFPTFKDKLYLAYRVENKNRKMFKEVVNILKKI